MNGRFSKLGLLLSTVALFFVTAVLPFHNHDRSAQASEKSHCSVCLFSHTSRSAAPEAKVSGLPSHNQSISIVTDLETFRSLLLTSNNSPRAPPFLS